MVRRYLHWLASDQDDRGAHKQPLVRVIQRPIAGDRNTSNVYVLLVPWAAPADVQRELEELKHVPKTALNGVRDVGGPQVGGVRACSPVGVAGAPQVGGAGAREEPSVPDPDREYSPLPPADEQQQGVWLEEPVPRSHEAVTVAEESGADSAQVLVAAFYRGLDANPEAVTATIRRRDMAIARQLVAAGATPEEAATYTRETIAASSRIAPIDLRSFERERLGWLARRRGANQVQGRFIDRTGQPASWEALPSEDRKASPGHDPTAPQQGPVSTRRSRPDLAGNTLRDALRGVLRGGQP